MANSSGYVGINGGGGGGSYVSLTGDESIDGVKTFTSFPVTPSSAPTSDYQTANKKYVDDNAGGTDVNVETLTGNKTLTANDAEYQILDPGGTNRYVYFPTSGLAVGQKFIIRNSAYYTHSYQLQVGTTYIPSSSQKEWMWNGSYWILLSPERNIDIGDTNGWNYNFAIGIGKDATNNATGGIGIGSQASGNSSYGIGIGYRARSNYNYGVGIGYYAEENHHYGTGIGYYADGNSKTYDIALGSLAKVERKGEYVEGIDTSIGNKAVHSKWKYYGQTTDGSTYEIYVRGISGNRMEILAKEVVQFTIQVTAIDSTNYDAKVWEVKGAIKRDASNNTSLVGSITKTVIAQDSGAANWDIFITADNTYNALKLEVSEVDTATGKTIRWAATSYNTEVRFTYLY